MATTTNYGWTTPDDTSLVKDGASAIRTLGTSVDTTTKNLNPETTLGDIAYRSSTSNVNTRLPIGTSGQFLSVVGGVPAWAALTDQTPLTTKGDLFTFSTIDARLGVGANNTVLTADSAEATGLKWATPASSGKVLQVVQATYATSTSNSTSTYADTGLTATITPSLVTSKVLAFVYQPIRRGGGSANNKLGIRLVRTSTTIHQSPDLLYTDTLAAHEADLSYSLSYLDSPATTSATTYKTTFANINNTASVTVQVDSRTSTLILMEIGA